MVREVTSNGGIKFTPLIDLTATNATGLAQQSGAAAAGASDPGWRAEVEMRQKAEALARRHASSSYAHLFRR